MRYAYRGALGVLTTAGLVLTVLVLGIVVINGGMRSGDVYVHPAWMPSGVGAIIGSGPVRAALPWFIVSGVAVFWFAVLYARHLVNRAYPRGEA